MTGSDIKIAVLDVGDADAIVVKLRRGAEQLVMLIDGGHSRDAPQVINELDHYLKAAGKKGPDIVLCTHYDGDHIGGLKKVIEHYNRDIALVLIHRTSALLDIAKTPRAKKGGIFPSENDLSLGGSDYMEEGLREGIDVVLESILQEQKLIELIDKLSITNKEPIAGATLINGWEKEISIIGPTEAYYKVLFPGHISGAEVLKTEALALLAERESESAGSFADSCEALAKLRKSTVTPVNLNSAIVKISFVGKTFLFAADAGIASFKNITEYEMVLSNIFWLKVPHHGSRNNITPELIKLMSPTVAVISGDKYVDDCVAGCLRLQGTEVDITRDAGTTIRYEYDEP